MGVILLYNQFVYKLIPWQIYSELHVCKVLSPKISISWYMYMYILCFRQMFSTEQVPATKKWFYAILFRYMSDMAACSTCITVIGNKIQNPGRRQILLTYRVSGIFHVAKFWWKWGFQGVLNFHWALFSLFQGLSMKT